MLWDAIRDFFVVNVFGGQASNGDFYSCLIGYGQSDNWDGDLFADSLLYSVGGVYEGDTGSILRIGLSDYLSTTATIITITIIVILCALFIYKIIKLIGGLIR